MNLKNIDPRNILSFLDELANKVPEKIASIITKVLIAILGVILIAAAYYGWNIGKEIAPEEGQSLADDTKSLFYEDIQREYNRKRRDVRMPDLNSALSESKYQNSMEYEYSTKNPPGSPKEVLGEDKANLENERNLRQIKRNFNSPPVIEEKEITTIQRPQDNIPGARISEGMNDENREDLIRNQNSPKTGRLLKFESKDIPKPTIRPSLRKNESETIEEKGYLRKKNPDDDLSPKPKPAKRQLIRKGSSIE